MKNSLFLLLVLLFGGDLPAQVSPSKVLVPYRVKNLWGFADTSGNLKVSAVYKSIEPNYYYNGEEKKTYARYVVKKTTAAYVLDENMLVKVPETYAYDSVKASIRYDWKDRYHVYKAGRVGMFVNGKQLISCQYDKIEVVENKSYVVEKDGLKGLVNSTGKLLIPVKYQRISQDNSGETNEAEITWIARGMIAMERFTDKRLAEAGWDDYLTAVEEAVAGVVAEPADPFATQKKELRKQYEAVRTMAGYDKYVYIEQTGMIGIYDLEKKQVLMEPRYTVLTRCSPGYAREPLYFRILENDMYGIINLKGEALIPAEYSRIHETCYGYELEKDGKKGAYIFERKLLIPPVYESLERSTYLNEGFILFYVKTAGGYGYVGENGVRFFKE
ncbi:MAG: WG repeat-containing protein [Bacteroidia bacterium]|nr:WG repeat-containing protein [Bacteroidia bacterium]